MQRGAEFNPARGMGFGLEAASGPTLQCHGSRGTQNASAAAGATEGHQRGVLMSTLHMHSDK